MMPNIKEIARPMVLWRLLKAEQFQTNQ